MDNTLSRSCVHGYRKNCCTDFGCRNYPAVAAGSLESLFGAQSDPRQAQALMARSPKEYAEKKKLAQERGLIVAPRVPVCLQTED